MKSHTFCPAHIVGRRSVVPDGFNPALKSRKLEAFGWYIAIAASHPGKVTGGGPNDFNRGIENLQGDDGIRYSVIFHLICHAAFVGNGFVGEAPIYFLVVDVANAFIDDVTCKIKGSRPDARVEKSIPIRILWYV